MTTTATPYEQTAQVSPEETQDRVQELVEKLFRATKELVKPSIGPSFYVTNDPHLRLRRTLTPGLPDTGIRFTPEAQFMIQGSSGKRINLDFSLQGKSFNMDAYAWGASEGEARHRVVAVHGLTPGISRARWHQLGERLARDSAQHKIRFVAIDWHSIDRSLDEPNNDFLTMLPKHYFSSLPEDTFDPVLDSGTMTPETARKFREAYATINEMTPRSFDDAAQVLRAVIEQGLEWGVSSDTKFVVVVKSWSGAVGLRMIANAKNDEFGKHVEAAVVAHPALFDRDTAAQAIGRTGIPVLLCWAKDDPKIPFSCAVNFTRHPNVKLVAYEKGGHHNFDGTQGLPNLDDELVPWLGSVFGC